MKRFCQFQIVGFNQRIQVNDHSNDENDEHLPGKNKPLGREKHGRFKTELFVSFCCFPRKWDRMIDQVKDERKTNRKASQNTDQTQSRWFHKTEFCSTCFFACQWQP